MKFPIIIGMTSLFQILGVLGEIFHFFSNSNRKFCEKTVETLIRRCRILRRLISVCAVSLCPTKRTLGLYGLITGSSYPKIALSYEVLYKCHPFRKGDVGKNFKRLR